MTKIAKLTTCKICLGTGSVDSPMFSEIDRIQIQQQEATGDCDPGWMIAKALGYTGNWSDFQYAVPCPKCNGERNKAS